MISALIVAAGLGSRMAAKQPKQYLKLDGRPILGLTIKAFDRCVSMAKIYVVIPETDLAYCQKEIVDVGKFTKPVTLVSGGERRQDSVFNGLKAIADTEGLVLIHDGVRPFLSDTLIAACIQAGKQYGACVPAIPVFDTLKQADAANCIRNTMSREGLYMAQTPQTFRLSLILKAHAEALKQGWEATDDAALVERLGEPVHIISGSRENIKITTPEDLAWAKAYLKVQSLKGGGGAD